MKFEVSKKSVFEISGIKRIVVNKIRYVHGEKVKVGKTFIWELTQTKKGLRWFKYDYALLEELKKNTATPEEYREFAQKAILDGNAPDKMHNSIQKAMRDKYMRVWFSGETCNVELNVTSHIGKLVLESTRNVMNYIIEVRKLIREAEES